MRHSPELWGSVPKICIHPLSKTLQICCHASTASYRLGDVSLRDKFEGERYWLICITFRLRTHKGDRISLKSGLLKSRLLKSRLLKLGFVSRFFEFGNLCQSTTPIRFVWRMSISIIFKSDRLGFNLNLQAPNALRVWDSILRSHLSLDILREVSNIAQFHSYKNAIAILAIPGNPKKSQIKN